MTRQIPPQYRTVSEFFNNRSHPPAERAWIALALALREHLEPEYQSPLEAPRGDDLPRWPSTLERLEQVANGFYGVSVIAGEKKLGKTRLALASAVAAAATQAWQVVYFSAELDPWEISDRLARMFETYPGTVDCEHFLHLYHLGRGTGPGEMRRYIEEATDGTGEPILVVLDSINTIAELMSPIPYLAALHEIGLWAMLSRRMSGGAVSWMLVSETNRTGGVKGGKLDYWADLIVRMRKPKDPKLASQRGAPVSITLDASRRTGGEGPLGLYLRDAGERFAEYREPVRLVQVAAAGGQEDLF